MNAKKKNGEMQAEAPAEQQADGVPYDSNEVGTRIQLRAYELWLQRGGGDGGADQDWLLAETEINSALGAPPPEAHTMTDEQGYSRSAVAR
jgi:hypothetical protein